MSIATSEGNLVLDSGIGTLLLFLCVGMAPPRGGHPARPACSSPASIARAPDLRIGGQVYHPGTAVFEARESTVVNGLLPASLFHAVFVCNSAGYVVIDP